MGQKTTFIATGFICLLIVFSAIFMYSDGGSDVVTEPEIIPRTIVAPDTTTRDDFIVPGEEDVEVDEGVTEDTPEQMDNTEDESDENQTDIPDYEEILQTEKVTAYHNAAYDYGFLIPYTHYYQGFGSQDGAVHTVGIHPDAEFETLADTEVRVYNYGRTRLPELADHNFLQQDGKTYIWLANTYSIMIEADSYDDPVLNQIIETIYYGPKGVEEVEEDEDSEVPIS